MSTVNEQQHQSCSQDSPRGQDAVYLDHAATSFPKPEEVGVEITRFLHTSAANPGRSGHRISAAAARLVFETRETLARFFGIRDSRRVIFTKGATEGLNLVLGGLLESGDHVVTTSMEHNAVMRPLRHLAESRGVRVTPVQASPEGLVDPDDFLRAVTADTRLAVLNHGSNVCGTVQPLAAIAKRLEGRTRLVVDAAQTGGLVSLDADVLRPAALVVSGHKALLGPPGIGVLCLGEGVDPRPLIHGGTGSRSESDEQPLFLPDKYEAGTTNTVGIAGLKGALSFIERVGRERPLAHELALTGQLLEGVDGIPEITVHGPRSLENRLAVISLSIAGVDPGEVGRRLDQDYGLLVRCGLHCAPAAHRTLGTFPQGTVRVSFGDSNTPDEVDRLVEALAAIAHG